MKKELNNNYLQIKTILKTTLVAFILMLFFIPASNLQAQNGDIDVTFHLFTDSYQVSYNFGDTITEIPSNQFLENNNVVFEGWYLDDFYGGDNYYGKIVDNNTPTTLYPRLVSKFPEEEYGSYTVIDYQDGYEIISYTGNGVDLNIPSYFYRETTTPNVYEIKNMLSIKQGAFINNDTIEEIIIPRTIKNLEDGVFDDLSSLTKISVDGDNSNYSSISGVLYNKSLTELIYFPKAISHESHYILPEGLEVIKSGSFVNTIFLEKLVLPSSLLEIETQAFVNNQSLKTVIAKDNSITIIGSKAFSNNASLEFVMIPFSTNSVGSEAFTGSNIGLKIYYQGTKPPATSWDSEWNKDNYELITNYNSISYQVVFKNHDETIFETQTVRIGESAGFSEEARPVKEGTPQYSYPFIGWDKNYEYVTSDLELIAQHRETPRSYTVRFHNANNDFIGQLSMSYGNENNNNWYMGQTKEPTAQYTYRHIGWNIDLRYIESDTDAYPVYEKTINQYDVTFYRDGEENIFEHFTVDYGSTVETPLTDPTKDSTAQFNYIFVGWFIDLEKTIPYDEQAIIIENLDVYPKFDEQTRKCTVKFFNIGVIYETQEVEYGTGAVTPANPTRLSTPQYKYNFAGWDKDFSYITGDLNINALYEQIIRVYEVKFYSDEVLLETQNIEYGQPAVTPIEPTKDSTLEYSYVFRNWDKDYSFITGNLDLIAVYDEVPNNYNVTYETNGGTLISAHLQPYGTYLNVPTRPAKTGHEFIGWYSDNEFVNIWEFNENRMPAEDLTIYVKWNINNYTISFNSNGGSLVDSITQNYGSIVVEPIEPTKTGYSFINWYSDISLETAYNFTTMPAENRTLYAGWSINEYTISFNSNQGSVVEPITDNFGAELQMVNPTKEGHSFTGWYLETSLINKFTSETMPAKDFTLYAGWSTNQYTISFNSNGGSRIDPITTLFDSLITEPAEPSKRGHSFTNWYSDLKLTTVYSFTTMPAENITLYAGWSINEFTITFESNEGSVVDSITALFGTSITEPPSPSKTGNMFNGWYSDEELTNYYIFTTMPGENITLYASWNLNQYKINFNSNGGSLVDSIKCDFGSTLTKPLNPSKEGNTFIDWYSDILLTTSYTFTTMPAENITLYAKWQANQYTITFNSNGGSLVEPITQDYGTNVHKPLNPHKEGYTFISWYSDIELTAPYTFSTMPAEDLTLYAGWDLNEYLVTFYSSVEETTNNSIFSTEYVLHGSDATLPINVPTKSSTVMYTYEFSGWSKDHTNITSDTNIYPLFTEKLREYNVNFYNEDNLIVTQKVPYGTAAVEPTSPTKEATAQYTYIFTGWDKDFSNITSNLNLYAVYDQVINSYIVTFYGEDQVTIISTQTVNYGSSATAPEAPLKEPTAELVFTFFGWSESYYNVTSDLDLYATYTSSARKYLVRFYNGSELITTQNIVYGKSAIAPNNPRKDSTPEYSYIFTNWDQDYSNIISDLDIYAVYQEVLNSYTITFNSNGGTAVSSLTQEYGTEIIKPANPIRTGYTFVSWDILIPETMPAEDLTITASWNINQYTINFNSNGGSLVESITEDYGTAVTKPVNPTKNHHTFTGWYLDTDLTTKYELLTMPAENITLYAKWQVNEYTITFVSNGGTLVEALILEFDSLIVMPNEPKRVGYTFINWYIDSELDETFSLINMPAEDITLYAGWSINEYTIKFNSNEGSLVDSVKTTFGSVVTAPTNPTKVGHSFINWYSEIELTTVYTFTTMPAEDITLYAGWKVNNYTITFNSNGGDSLAPMIASFGSVINEPQPVRSGYSFISWYIDNNLTTTYEFSTMPAENLTLYAKWKINEYTVTFYNDDETYLGEVIVTHGANAIFMEPTKESTTQYDYEFINWSLSILNVMEDLEVYAVYQEVLRKYQVRFYRNEFVEGEANPVLSSIYVDYGFSATAPNPPTKNATVKYTYTFANWDQDLSVITQNIDVYPVFTENLRQYVVKFIFDDYITVIEEVLVTYGEAAIGPVDPIKESTPRYHYEFIGWDKDFSNITANLNVFAQYQEILRTYTVTFYNEDQIIKQEEVFYGRAAVTPSEPSKNSTGKYHYNFIGWSEEVGNIKNDLDVYAEYEEVLRIYNIYFFNDNLILIGQTQAYYGEPAIFAIEPNKEPSAQYTYEFIGWDKDISSIEQSMQVYAVYEKTLRSYDVLFYNDDGVTLLKEETVNYGSSATPPEAPLKAPDQKYTYVFSGWNLDYTFIDGHMELYAEYDKVLNRYTISFYNDDLSLYETLKLDYGSKISLPLEPTKEASDEFEYLFFGWYKDSEYLIPYDELEPVTKNISFYAKFDQEIRIYQVNFYNGLIIHNSQEIKYGQAAVTPSVPAKESTAQYDYEFIGWSEDYTNINSDLNLYAQYQETLRTYIVKFFDGIQELDSQNVSYGKAAIAPVNPVREKTNKYEYEFIGWDRDFSNIEGNLNVYARFKEKLREFTVNFYNATGEVIKTQKVMYDKPATAPEAPLKEPTPFYEYTFTGWDKSFSYIYNDLDIYPVYDEETRLYTINFYNEEHLIETQNIAYGQDALAPVDPTKESTLQYKYIFTGWSEDYTNIQSNLNVYANYKEVLRKYTVRFYDDDEVTIIDEQEVNYGEGATRPVDPIKESTQQYHYEFAGWSEDFSNITENLVVFAKYQETLVQYTINFYTEDGLISTQKVNYGGFANAPNEPIKADTERYTYQFVGWSESLINITSDLEIYALFEENIKTFNVIFYLDDQESILKNHLNIPYGTSATAPANPTKRPSIKYEYTFTGWDKDFTDVRSDLNIFAIFKENLREYTVNFYNDDNSLLKTLKVPYGSNAIAPEAPTKKGTQQYKYLFSGWDKEFTDIEADLNVYAQYLEEINSYDVIFKDSYGNVYKKETLVYGSIITLPEIGPEKETDEQFSYVFSSWDGYIEDMTIRENLTFEPLYETTGVIYEITIIVDHKETHHELAYGEELPGLSGLKDPTNKYTYIINGALINDEFVKIENFPETVKENLKIELKYDSYINRLYYISYVNEINLKSINSYISLVEAHNMLEELSVENYEEMHQLLNEKTAVYNELVNNLNQELEIVERYEEKIFKGLLEISLSIQSLSYLVYLSMRKGFYYA